MSNQRNPNIIIIQPDEFRQRAMGFRGEDPVLTPNLDKFASQSIELNNFYSTYPVCSPYRAMLFTGQYPCRNGVIGNSNSQTAPFNIRLRRNAVCLSDALKAAGYFCGYIGKWHLDSPSIEDAPFLEPRRDDGIIWDAYTSPEHRHGFDYWFSYGCNDHHFTPGYWRNNDRVDEIHRYQRWSPYVETDEALAFIRNDDQLRPDNQPFFLMVSYNPPHMPFDQVPAKYKAHYTGQRAEDLLTSPVALRPCSPEVPVDLQNQTENFLKTARSHVGNYFAAVTGIDDQFGRILKALDEKGISDDCIVLFTSDHGDMMGSHSLMYKGIWYRDSVRVPFLLRWPGHLPSGVRNDTFINPPDIYPTIMGLIDRKEYLPDTIEGRDFSAALLSGTKTPNIGYYFNPFINARGLEDERYTFITVRNRRDEEHYILYDLLTDPNQCENIADISPEIVMNYRAKLQRKLVETDDLWL